MTTNFTEIDFQKIRESIIEFLKTKDEFKDYNFAGSGVATLIDILAYNTQYNAFYLNMVANEMFLDTATLRDSVVSRAKAIGYRPNSAKSAVARVTVQVDSIAGPGPANPANILLPKWSKFTTSVENKTYTFLNKAAVILQPVGGGLYEADLDIYQGNVFTHQFIVDDTIDTKQRYIIPNTNVDVDSINVKVQESSASPSIQSFSLSKDINIVGPDDAVFWLQETEDGLWEIYFGDGVVGKKVENGNIIIIEYMNTSGSLANTARRFTLVTSVGSYNRSTVTTIEAAKNGLEAQSIESIKFVAPQFYQTQNRAVNKHDYVTLIKKDYPQVEFATCWGGEENDPPIYGKVFLALKPTGAFAFSEQEKLSIINTIIRPRNPVSIQVEIVEPDYLQILVDSVVKYSAKSTTLTLGDVQQKAINAIKGYASSNLNGFDSTFRYSKLTKAIDNSDVSITNNLTTIKLKYTITPPINIPAKYDINTNAKISKGDANNNISGVNSTAFTRNGVTSYIGDDGQGNLYIYRVVVSQKVIMERNVGTVNYDTGKISIPSLVIEGIPTGAETIDFILTPAQNDLTPIRNQILLINDSDITVTMVNQD